MSEHPIEPPGLLARFRASGKPTAFLIHVALSALVVGSVGLAMVLLWYPPPYFQFDGGLHVLRIIVVADVVLGPLLTLIVFRRGKPGLRRDLGIIGTVQIVALVYGSAIMVIHRPAFVVYGENNFFTVTWPEVGKATRDLARLEAFRASRGPGFVNLRLPEDKAERARLRGEIRRGGPAVIHMGDFYESITPEQYDRIFAATLPVERTASDDPALAADLAAFVRDHGNAPEKLAFVPVTGRFGVILLVFDRATRRIIGWLT